jgi:hypothetical protein
VETRMGTYGQRFANIEGQYVTQKTVTYLISSALIECFVFGRSLQSRALCQ